MRQYWVYILAGGSGELYTGVTNNLELRVAQHRLAVKGYTARKRIKKLVYYETTGDVISAIRREKEIKGWKRLRKLELIESMNPGCRELLPEE